MNKNKKSTYKTIEKIGKDNLLPEEIEYLILMCEITNKDIKKLLE